MKYNLFIACLAFSAITISGFAQQTAKPQDTEFYEPVPKLVSPAKSFGEPPADAIILFNGNNIDQWVSTNDTTQAAKWNVSNGELVVNKSSGNIQTKQSFNDYQLHIEWKIPANITGTGQGRGNSGVFLSSIGRGDAGYELQVLDSYNNNTYVNGQAASIYKQHIPLANPTRPPGEWQTYDIAWTAPRFNDDGSLKTPARVTVFFNGVLVQNNVELKGPTLYIGQPSYKRHGAGPIKLQSHGDKSEPISFRNIWIRPV